MTERLFPYRCIMFDLDDTLWACKPVIEMAERGFYRWSEEHHEGLVSRYTPEQLVASRIAFMRAHPHWHHNLTLLRKQWLNALAQECGLHSSFVEEGFHVYWLARNRVTLFEGVSEFLQRLKTQYVVGSITNGNADVNHIGIDHLFDFSVTSIEAGVAKPHRGIFDLAARRAGVALPDILHVGDDWQRDVLGALEAGSQAVWVRLSPDQAMPETPSDRVPSYTVDSVLELESVLLPTT